MGFTGIFVFVAGFTALTWLLSRWETIDEGFTIDIKGWGWDWWAGSAWLTPLWRLWLGVYKGIY